MKVLLTQANRDLANGTSLRGYVKTTFATLVALFGEPDVHNGDGKVRVSWTLSPVGEKVPVTIYDWKDPTPVEKVTDWHIGGKSPLAITLIQQVLPEARSAY